ncbi:MAG: hypothetical protein GFH27_549307n85 [Chloroflexi bacterium AL-W]|nr:hypothetical protein [Chloroflexi bacterium AL-N1]NOK69117.1 hypothetical protein [Chloroflexi bacterium AL-N10]NOK77100.1 hypothetical protein [Chloroflexi bacterium AL-N5]NOK83745.1 hypothetical protein [Chloroflexi bacterium AL-W]NOK90955.1 hypothetical protein [Chloroflexi bacterium AL-N15]
MIFRSFQRFFALLCVLTMMFTLTSTHTATPTQAQDERPVMAFYYPWYEPSDWSYARMSDIAAPQYQGGDEDVLQRHIQQADDAGIDALICTWYGPNEDRLDGRCRRMLQLVEESGRDLKIAIIPDQSASFIGSMRTVGGLAEAIGVLRRDFTSSPAYFTFEGKPAVFWFNPPSLGGVGTWEQLRNQADPNRDQYWFGGTDNFNYLDVYDALYYYDITWESTPGLAMNSYAGRLENYNSSRGTNKPFIATVMTGYDDLRIRPNGHRRNRSGGEYYRGTWQTAMDRNADAVVLTSFNEFYEGTHIEPSEQFGDLYLRLTQELSAQFRSYQPPPPPPDGGPCRAFPETGHQVCGRMLEFWEQNGGLPVFGFPITEQFEEQIEGKAVQTQIFERNRLELHPENDRPYDVLLGRLGVDSLEAQERDWTSFGRSDPNAPNYFAETGQAIAPEFWGYWSSNGLEFDGQAGKSFAESLALFGMPISAPVMEVNPTDGQEYLTQHFERARFEYHPENAGTPYVVLLGLLGRELNGIE